MIERATATRFYPDTSAEVVRIDLHERSPGGTPEWISLEITPKAARALRDDLNQIFQETDQ